MDVVGATIGSLLLGTLSASVGAVSDLTATSISSAGLAVPMLLGSRRRPGRGGDPPARSGGKPRGAPVLPRCPATVVFPRTTLHPHDRGRVLPPDPVYPRQQV